LEVDLDFSEEGISLIGKAEIDRKIRETKERLERLAGTFKTGKIYRDGVSVVIVGPPNAGKSSLFNALLKESRAIVTPIPGTTRDYLEESLSLKGVLYRITDTAGLRKSEDPIESEGIARTVTSVESADIVIFVDEAGGDLTEREELVGSLPITGSQELILVRNKIDLKEEGSEKLPHVNQIELKGGIRIEVSLSALSGAGVHALAEQLVHIVGESELSAQETVSVISERHAESLSRGARSLEIALQSLTSGMTNEFVAFDIRESLSALGEITGEITSEEILNSIFGEFCIGK
jgi:tRNA modification GTPase